jgi:hypothetical protein
MLLGFYARGIVGVFILTESDFFGPFWHEIKLSKLGIHVVQRVMHLSDG